MIFISRMYTPPSHMLRNQDKEAMVVTAALLAGLVSIFHVIMSVIVTMILQSSINAAPSPRAPFAQQETGNSKCPDEHWTVTWRARLITSWCHLDVCNMWGSSGIETFWKNSSSSQVQISASEREVLEQNSREKWAFTERKLRFLLTCYLINTIMPKLAFARYKFSCSWIQCSSQK